LRTLRKHKIALAALAIYHFIFFFPALFMARLPSPNDVYFNYDPWQSVRSVDVQNALLNDPPTSYFTLFSLLKTNWRAFHWNPFIASGVPGFGSSAAAVLSPFIFVPVLLLPLGAVFAGIILLKLNAAFFFTYLWLREERLGKRGAAVGAIVFAASGAIAIRWWWQATNATSLYPALLWIALRVARGKRVPVWSVALIALSYALAGFPATMAYGAWMAVAYFAVRVRRVALRPLVMTAAAVVLAIVIAMPSLAPMISLVRRSGYLETRATAAATFAFPPRHLLMFVAPYRLGSHAYHNWSGDRALGILNNDVEATVYLGLVALPLILIALFNRRARSRWFWLVVLLLFGGAMFGAPVAREVFAQLPGFKYSSLTRLQLALPLPAAYLAAAGASLLARKRWRTTIAMVIAIAASADLGVFAARFYPFLEPSLLVPQSTPTIEFLRAQPKPFRIAPFFLYLWPNTSELFGVEDIRSHFSSERDYRALLQRVDPSSFETSSTILELNSLQFGFRDPLVAMLGVRYYLENRSIDIVKWKIFGATEPGVKEVGSMSLGPGVVTWRTIPIDAQPFYAIEIPMSVSDVFSRTPSVVVQLIRGDRAVWQRAFTPADISVLEKIYVPLWPYARSGEVKVVVRVIGMKVSVLTGEHSSLFYGRVTVPLIFDRQLPDGRLFRNVAEVPRFHSVTRVRRLQRGADSQSAGAGATLAAQFLDMTKETDFADEAIVTDARELRLAASPAEVTLRRYAEDEQVVDVVAAQDTFVATSEKLTPELRVRLDGREVQPVEINMLFAGVPVPAGRHQLVFTRRIGRGWWAPSAIALVLLIGLSISDVRQRRP
jgi:hypothetical protein